MDRLDRILSRVSKPARYAGGEWNSVTKDWRGVRARLALAFPDVYEIGMSNFGLSILYELVNARPDFLAERVFAPWTDMEAEMRREGVALYSLESRRPLADFDVVGFSLGYELTYTNVLNMLDLGRIPLRAAERGDDHPLVIAGGAGAYNPEPLADFVDLFVVGDGEEVLLELLDAFAEASSRPPDGARSRFERQAFLRRAATIPGIYVPGFYRPVYNADGTLASLAPIVAEAAPSICRRLVTPLPPATVRPVVPNLNTVHDRGAIEIMRGCPGGCRFCQAGHNYRPVRLRSREEILQAADDLLANTGYEELALLSLSTGDYPHIDELVRALAERHPDVNISLPSLRIDSFSVALAESVQRRKTSLTFAPEAGTQRLRDVIRKRVTEDDLLRAVEAAYGSGWSTVKLYFMIGLPTETETDVRGIGDLARKARAIGRRLAGHRAQLHVSVASFIPKPHTPFQWAAQTGGEELAEKQRVLRASVGREAKLDWHDPETSFIEAALSRGDRRLGQVIERAWRLGCRFDAWDEHFRPDLWQQAAKEVGLDLAFYARRERSLDELLPWAHIQGGARPELLRREYAAALAKSGVTEGA